MYACIETVVVLYNAGPLDVSWAVGSDKVVAILESYFPGQVSQRIIRVGYRSLIQLS
jgi:hypothetical protein